MKFQDLEFIHLEKILFWIIIVVSLYPIWSNTYFLTGDGPCHLYNSKVLLDFITSTNVDFYSEYYELNQNTEPNWFSHICLAFLLSFLSNSLAEKVFLTLYVVLFALLLRSTLRAIAPKNTFLVFLGLPFMFHQTLQLGFFNFSFGIVFCFLSVRYWLVNRDRLNWIRLLVFALINLLTYFTHPIGFLLSGLIIGSMPLSEWIISIIRKWDSFKPAGIQMLKTYGRTVIGFLPGLLFMLEYLTRKGLNPTPNNVSLKRLYHQFIELASLINLSEKEGVLAIGLSLVFGITAVYVMAIKARNRNLTGYDGFFGAFLLIVFVYFNQPGTLVGGSMLGTRLQMIAYLLMLLWFAQAQFGPIPKKSITISAVSITLLFSVIRIPIHRLASIAVKEYVSVGKMIPTRSTVLPLSYSHNGKTPEGDQVSNGVWLFMHAFDYLGTDRSLVLFGNYEANTGYFPIIWKDDKNPFKHLGQGHGLEYLPPGLDILNYELTTGGKIEYVVTWCLDDQFMEYPSTQHLLEELSARYELIFTSEHGLAKLYRRSSAG